MRSKAVIFVVAIVVLMTMIIHTRMMRPIWYALFPGIAASLTIAGGHGGTIAQERAALIVELGVNLAAYIFATLGLRWLLSRRQS
jgi:hypothetical protein